MSVCIPFSDLIGAMGQPLREENLLKRNIVFALCLALSLPAFSQAPASQQPASPSQTQQPPSSGNAANQTPEQVEEANVQMMRADIRAERKKIVAANMPLTETEATRFWPVYDRYIGETIKVNDNRYALIKEYANTRESMTDTQANSLIKRWLALDGENTQLRLKYIPE